MPIMTIHKSKGLEYEIVVFIGLEDEMFWNFQNQQTEEIRNFFVALSRAKRHVIFTFCRNRGESQNKSSQHNIKIKRIYELLAQSDLAT